MLYRGVMVFSVLGLGISFYGIYLMATGNMKKKGESWTTSQLTNLYNK